MTDAELDTLEKAARVVQTYTDGLWEVEEKAPISEYIAAANPAAILELIAELRQVRELCHEHELYIADLERSERMYDHALKSFAGLLGEEHDEGWMPEIDILINALHELKDDLRQARAERDWLVRTIGDVEARECPPNRNRWAKACRRVSCKECWLQAAKEAVCQKK